MKISMMLPKQLPNFLNRLDGSHFIVAKHNGHKNCFIRKLLPHIIDAYAPHLINWQIRYAKAFLFKLLARM
ncbi:hypothetical protein D3C84_1197330 [compost metagenome]